MNRNAILQLEHAAGLLASLGPLADTLAKDLTPMPDGQGTVADRFKATVLKLAPPMDQLWDAATGQAEAVTHAAVADEASEIIGQGNGKAALPAKQTVTAPKSVSAPHKPAIHTPAPVAPGRGPAGILPAPHRKTAGS